MGHLPVEVAVGREHHSIEMMLSALEHHPSAHALENAHKQIRNHQRSCRQSGMLAALERLAPHVQRRLHDGFDDIEEIFEQIGVIGPSGDLRSKRLITRLHHAVRRHIEFEESVVLPVLRARMSTAVMQEMATSLAGEHQGVHDADGPVTKNHVAAQV